MADLDTPQKRFSGIHVSSPWRGVAVVPTGTVDQAERQAAAFFYTGILASSPGGVTFQAAWAMGCNVLLSPGSPL